MKKLNNIVMYVIYDIYNKFICKCDYYDLSQFIISSSNNNKKEKRGGMKIYE